MVFSNEYYESLQQQELDDKNAKICGSKNPGYKTWK
jgi:hypothetical protein